MIRHKHWHQVAGMKSCFSKWQFIRADNNCLLVFIIGCNFWLKRNDMHIKLLLYFVTIIYRIKNF